MNCVVLAKRLTRLQGRHGIMRAHSHLQGRLRNVAGTVPFSIHSFHNKYVVCFASGDDITSVGGSWCDFPPFDVFCGHVADTVVVGAT